MHRLPLVLVACVALVLCTSPVVRGTQERAPAQAGPERRTYSYGPFEGQRLTAYSDPDPGRPGPRRTGLVIVHGGFWYQDRSAGWNRWARRIAGAGPAVFNLDYRPNTRASWPAQRSDVLRAVNWIRQRAGHFGVDPRRLVLLGSSAGGQLATSAGAHGQGRHHLAGVVALSPVVDPYRSWRSTSAPDGDDDGMAVLRDNAVRLAGCEPGPGLRSGQGREPEPERRRGRADGSEACRRVWRDMSATRHASGAEDPPMLLIHSRHDFVPVAHSEALRMAELRRGMPPGDVTVVTVPGAEHGGGLLGSPGVERMLLSWVAARAQSSAPTSAPTSAPAPGTPG